MNICANEINSCAEALDKKLSNDIVAQIKDEVADSILDLEVSFNDGDEDKFEKAINKLKHISIIY